MRVLLALGGNAMTNAEGRARVEDQQEAADRRPLRDAMPRRDPKRKG